MILQNRTDTVSEYTEDYGQSLFSVYFFLLDISGIQTVAVL